MTIRTRYLSLIVLTGIVVVSLFVAGAGERAFGEITVERTQITRENGRIVHFSVYKSRAPNYGEPMPAILTIHGISGSREAMEAYNIELARRNFTVVSVDIAGHGVSVERFGFSTFMEAITDAYEAVRHVQMSDPFTNENIYGVVGHSLGAGMALLFQEMPILPNATVIIGGGMGSEFGGILLPLNQTNPANLLIASGVYDELVDPEVAFDTLRIATGQENVETNIIYGSFQNGTARKLVLSNTNHLFEITDHLLVTNTIDWMERALQENKYSMNRYPPDIHLYQYRGFSNFIAIAGIVLSIIPIILITYSNLPKQFKPKQQVIREFPINRNESVRLSLLLSIMGGVVLLSVVFVGFGLDFSGISLLPISFGTTIILYSVIMFLLNKFVLKRELGDDLDLYQGTRGNNLSYLKENLPRSIMLITPIIVWIISWSLLSTYVVKTRLPLMWPVEGISAVFRSIYLFILLLALVPLFYSEKIWFNVTIGANKEWRGFKDFGKDVLESLLYRLGGFVILLLILYGPFMVGIRFGFIMFVALLMLPFTLIIGISAVMNLWTGRVTKNDFTSAIVASLLLALVIAGTFQLL
ncbi:MAG: hypothetical protein GF411_17650 [Candidatus Lokiarchaeota archaeon]|nr:hypothetical protein [Candidatus Lokiarchaeota archaeon]